MLEAPSEFSPRLTAWLAAARRGAAGPAIDPQIRALEQLLEPHVSGRTQSAAKEYARFVAGDSSGVTLGQLAAWSKRPFDFEISAGTCIPAFADTCFAILGVAPEGRVFAEWRHLTGPPALFARSLKVAVERIICMAHGTSYRWPVSWTGPSFAIPEARSAWASDDDESWWDEGAWIAREHDGQIDVWFEDESTARRFFSTPRPRGRLITKSAIVIAGQPNRQNADLLTHQLDPLVPGDLVQRLRQVGARFDPALDRDPPPSLAALQKAWGNLSVVPAAQEIEARFAGLTFGCCLVGVKTFLLGNYAHVPWPQETGLDGHAVTIEGRPATPFAVRDVGDASESYWIDSDGVIYEYSMFNGGFSDRRWTSFADWLRTQLV